MAIKITDIVGAINHKRVLITDHADEEAENDQLTMDEVYFSVLQGEVIEQYKTDKPYPSCLVYGQSFGGKGNVDERTF